MCDVIQELVNEERVSAKAEGVAEGEAIGIRKEKTAMVNKMLIKGTIPTKDIADISGLSLSEINILAKELQDS